MSDIKDPIFDYQGHELSFKREILGEKRDAIKVLSFLTLTRKFNHHVHSLQYRGKNHISTDFYQALNLV